MKHSLLSVLTVLAITIAGCGSTPEPVSITISPVGNEMKFATTEFTVKPKQKVTLVMKNTATLDVMKHNVVVVNSFSNVDQVGQQALNAPGYIPNNAAIIAATPMADAGATTQITFTAPDKTGDYPYICTFPGHYTMMRGVMKVKK
jgi:azurin